MKCSNSQLDAILALIQASLANDLRQPGRQVRTGLARVSEAAKFLGVSRPYLYKLIRNDEVPVKRIGSAVRIPWAWLEAQATTDDSSCGD